MGAEERETSPTEPQVEIHVNDSLLSRSVRSVLVEDHDRLIDKAELEILDLERQCSDFLREEDRVRVTLGWRSEHATLFEGFVRRVRIETDAGARRVFKATAYDLSYHMALTVPEPRDHPAGKLSDIITEIVRPYAARGIQIGTIEPDPDPVLERPLRQANKSDWQFIQDLTLAYGGRAFVEYNEGASRFYYVSEQKLMSQDPQGVLRLCRGFSQVHQFEVQRVAAWSAMQRVTAAVNPETGEVVQSPEPLPRAPDPPAEPDAEHTEWLAREYGSSQAGRYQAAAQLAAANPGNPADQRPARRAAGVASDPELAALVTRVDPTRVSGLRGEGIANGTVFLRAKGKVELQGIAVWADGDWYVARAVHEVRNNRYLTRFVVTR